MSMDFVRFIALEQKKGKGIAQINADMIRKGIDSATANSAIKRYLYVRRLADYIAAQKSSGYKQVQVYSVLQQRGYRQADIEQAESLDKFHIPKVAIFASIAVLAVVAVIAVLMLNQPEALLDYEASSEQKTYNPGDTLTFNIKLTNFGSDKRYDVVLEHRIMNNNNELIDMQKETIAVETQTTKRVTMDIPSDSKDGKYFLVTVATYENQRAESGFGFNIQTGTVQENITIIPQENKTVIIPPANITVPDDDKLKDLLDKQQNASDDTAVDNCALEEDELYQDYCWDKLATKTNSEEYCAEISDNEKRDFCFLTIALNKLDITICERINKKSVKSSCTSI